MDYFGSGSKLLEAVYRAKDRELNRQTLDVNRRQVSVAERAQTESEITGQFERDVRFPTNKKYMEAQITHLEELARQAGLQGAFDRQMVPIEGNFKKGTKEWEKANQVAIDGMVPRGIVPMIWQTTPDDKWSEWLKSLQYKQLTDAINQRPLEAALGDIALASPPPAGKRDVTAPAGFYQLAEIFTGGPKNKPLPKTLLTKSILSTLTPILGAVDKQGNTAIDIALAATQDKDYTAYGSYSAAILVQRLEEAKKALKEGDLEDLVSPFNWANTNRNASAELAKSHGQSFQEGRGIKLTDDINTALRLLTRTIQQREVPRNELTQDVITESLGKNAWRNQEK